MPILIFNLQQVHAKVHARTTIEHDTILAMHRIDDVVPLFELLERLLEKKVLAHRQGQAVTVVTPDVLGVHFLIFELMIQFKERIVLVVMVQPKGIETRDRDVGLLRVLEQSHVRHFAVHECWLPERLIECRCLERTISPCTRATPVPVRFVKQEVDWLLELLQEEHRLGSLEVFGITHVKVLVEMRRPTIENKIGLQCGVCQSTVKEERREVVVGVPQHDEDCRVLDQGAKHLCRVEEVSALHQFHHLEQLRESKCLAKAGELSDWGVESALFVVDRAEHVDVSHDVYQ